MKVDEKSNILIQKLMEENPNTKLSIGYLHKGETSFKLFDATGEIPYESYAYEIASISKVFTTSLLAKYLQEGKMNLSDSVAKYIPELDKNKYYPTLQRLATHTAGYQTEALTLLEMIKLSIAHTRMIKRKKPSSCYWNGFFMDYKKLIWFANKNKLEDKDYDWGYSDYSIALLAEAICQIVGKPFDELMTELLNYELGLKYTKTTTDRPDMLDGYFFNHNVGTMKAYRNGDYTAPAGGITSTAEDMLKFAKMNIEENPSYLGLCHKTYASGQEHFNMGLGWLIWTNQEHETHAHLGGSEGFSGNLAFRKGPKTATVVLTNCGTHGVADELSKAIFQANADD